MAEDPAPVAYLGHLDAIKPGLTACGESAPSPRAGGTGRRRWPAWSSSRCAICRRGCCRPGSAAGWRWRGWCWRGAGLWLLDEPTLGLDAASVERLGGLLAAHRAAGRGGGGGDASAAAAAGRGGVAALSMAAALLGRELRLSVRHGADTLAAVLFFVLAGALFPLAIGPAPEVLARLAPGIVWVVRAARGAAAARPAVRRGSRGWIARPVAAVRVAGAAWWPG